MEAFMFISSLFSLIASIITIVDKIVDMYEKHKKHRKTKSEPSVQPGVAHWVVVEVTSFDDVFPV